MWKKEEELMAPKTAETAGAATSGQAPGRVASRSSFATIGPSIVIRGEVTGDEDLLIQGQVDGSVALGLHAVTVGDGGRVKAGITGRVITVEGSVEGDLSAQEQIILRGTARVRGDLNAPRVVLEDGATFRGLVDMGPTDDAEPSKSTHRKEELADRSASGPRTEKRNETASARVGVPAPAGKDRDEGGKSEDRAGKPTAG